jgi:hypothetical protein
MTGSYSAVPSTAYGTASSRRMPATGAISSAATRRIASL